MCSSIVLDGTTFWDKTGERVFVFTTKILIWFHSLFLSSLSTYCLARLKSLSYILKVFSITTFVSVYHFIHSDDFHLIRNDCLILGHNVSLVNPSNLNGYCLPLFVIYAIYLFCFSHLLSVFLFLIINNAISNERPRNDGYFEKLKTT